MQSQLFLKNAKSKELYMRKCVKQEKQIEEKKSQQEKQEKKSQQE